MKTPLFIFSFLFIFFVNMTATAQKTILSNSSAAKRLDSLLQAHETDPQVTVTEVNSVPRWNGNTLTNGTLYDNGYAVGIHTISPQASLHVLGNDETLILQEVSANSVGTGTMLLLKGHTASQNNSEGRIGLVPEDGFYPYRSGAIEIRPQSRTNFYKSFNVTNPSNLAMTIVNSGIGIGTPSPDASAVLDISSASQGLLIPRMSADERTAIANPANGLLVYQTNASRGIYYYDETTWKAIGACSATASSVQAGNTDEMNSLKNQIAKQQSEIDELKTMITSLSSSAGDLQTNTIAVSLSGASLGQNMPNPFRSTATINYTLPAACASARLVIKDNDGKTVKEIGLPGKGSGSVVINAAALAAGTYRYSLLADGKLVDIKQMMVVK